MSTHIQPVQKESINDELALCCVCLSFLWFQLYFTFRCHRHIFGPQICRETNTKTKKEEADRRWQVCVVLKKTNPKGYFTLIWKDRKIAEVKRRSLLHPLSSSPSLGCFIFWREMAFMCLPHQCSTSPTSRNWTPAFTLVWLPAPAERAAGVERSLSKVRLCQRFTAKTSLLEGQI